MTRNVSTAAAAQWTRLWVDASFLMADAAMVMSMRGWRLMAGGRSAAREAERMFGEKVEAGLQLAGALASGRVRTPKAPPGPRSPPTASTSAPIGDGSASRAARPSFDFRP